MLNLTFWEDEVRITCNDILVNVPDQINLTIILWLQVIIPSATLGHETSELNWSRLYSPVEYSTKQP